MMTHRASDEQVRHCQSWRRPCQRGSPPSSWSRSRRRGSTDATLRGTQATCCWSSGSRLENHLLTPHLVCRDNMCSDFFVSFYENWCASTHQPRPLLGILLILLLDISPPDSVKEDFSFEPLKYSLFNFLSILKFLSISRPRRKGKRDPLICLSFGHWNIFSLVFFASYSNFGYFFTRLCKGKL